MKKIFAFIFICQLGFAQTKQTLQTFEGQINGKIAITLALVLEDNLVYGTLRYKVVGEAIKVIGSLENSKVLLHEFDSKGNVTGIYFGTKKRRCNCWFVDESEWKRDEFFGEKDRYRTD